MTARKPVMASLRLGREPRGSRILRAASGKPPPQPSPQGGGCLLGHVDATWPPPLVGEDGRGTPRPRARLHEGYRSPATRAPSSSRCHLLRPPEPQGVAGVPEAEVVVRCGEHQPAAVEVGVDQRRDELFALGVEGGGGLVHQPDRPVGEQQAGQRQAPRLPGRRGGRRRGWRSARVPRFASASSIRADRPPLSAVQKLQVLGHRQARLDGRAMRRNSRCRSPAAPRGRRPPMSTVRPPAARCRRRSSAGSSCRPRWRRAVRRSRRAGGSRSSAFEQQFLAPLAGEVRQGQGARRQRGFGVHQASAMRPKSALARVK